MTSRRFRKGLHASTPPSVRRLVGRCLDRDLKRRLRDSRLHFAGLNSRGRRACCAGEEDRADGKSEKHPNLLLYHHLCPVGIIVACRAASFARAQSIEVRRTGRAGVTLYNTTKGFILIRARSSK